jgi:hypothetical protein
MTYADINFATVAAFWVGCWGSGYYSGVLFRFTKQIFEKL